MSPDRWCGSSLQTPPRPSWRQVAAIAGRLGEEDGTALLARSEERFDAATPDGGAPPDVGDSL